MSTVIKTPPDSASYKSAITRTTTKLLSSRWQHWFQLLDPPPPSAGGGGKCRRLLTVNPGRPWQPLQYLTFRLGLDAFLPLLFR